MLGKLQFHSLVTAVVLLPTLVLTAQEANAHSLVFNNPSNYCIRETQVASEKIRATESLKNFKSFSTIE